MGHADTHEDGMLHESLRVCRTLRTRMAERKYAFAAGDESAAEARRALTRDMWRGRLRGVQRNVEVWQALLSVRTLVLPMHQDTHTWLKFASLCRKSARPKQSRRTLQQLLGYDPAEVPPGQPGFGGGSGKPDIMFGFVKHLWQCNDRHDALSRLRDLSHEVTAAAPSLADVAAAQAASQPGAPVGPAMARLFATPAGCVTGGYRASLLARVHRRLGVWLWALTGKARLPGRRVSPQTCSRKH